MRNLKSSLVIVFILAITACSKTTVLVKSTPPGADVVLKRTGVTVTTDKKIEISENEIFGNNRLILETFVFVKEGYRTKEIEQQLFKDKNNRVSVNLDKYDTSLEIKSTPTPIHIEFAPDATLPQGWPRTFTTPIKLECTNSEAQALSAYRLLVDADNIKGYIPTGNYRSLISSGYPLNSSLKPGRQNSITIPLKPVVTTLQVVSDPEGAVVEDISTGGFGYLGKTPLIRNFNWEDVESWSDRIATDTEKVGNKRKKLFGNTLYINLRLSKPGFQDAFLRRLRLPVGEERSFHKNMNAVNSVLTFASDPAGAHVYASKERRKEIYDPATGEFIEKIVPFSKHLGSTPFTLNLDPTDPLQHGDKLIFEKSGYKTGSMEFADGEANYYKVMVPVNIKER